MNTTPSRRAHPPLDWRNRLLRIFAAFLAVAMLASAHTCSASADTSTGCIINGQIVIPCPGTADYSPPDLLNLSQPPYTATAAQTASLKNLEQQAISNVVADHGLASTDGAAVKSWGRDDADTELYGLLMQAITATTRSPDQQNAVDWLTAVEQRKAEEAAQDAGLEYVKWAGLNQTAYQHLLGTDASQSDLQSFLTIATPNGYCSYRSPAPYQSEYTGYHDQTCFTPCTNLLGCTPPTPTYDQFVNWGVADANYQLLNSSEFAQAARNISIGLGFGLAAGGVTTALVVIPAVLIGPALGTLGAASSILFPFAAVTGVTVAGVAAFVTVVLVAIAIAVVAIINIINFNALPGQMAALIVNARTVPPDLTKIVADPKQAAGLYSLFVGATMPTPRNQTCDNTTIFVIGGSTPAPCLNPTTIPAATTADPEFAIQAKGGTAKTYATALSFKDSATQTTTTARLSGNWFIDQVTTAGGSTSTVQTLRIAYTDWNGAEQNAWLIDSPTGGYKFLGFSVPADTSTAVDPSTCVSSGICSFSSSIDFVGTDGNEYSASVLLALPSVAPSVSANPVEASPVTFTANGSSPVGLPLTYQWQFEQPSSFIIIVIGGGVSYDYTAPVSGPAASYTWTTSGTFHVQLTATDSAGKQTVDTFTVTVGDVPPTLYLYPPPPGPLGCIALCNTYTVPLGSVTTLAGAVGHTGGADTETVVVDWGDSTAHDTTSIGAGTVILGSSLTLTATSITVVNLSDTHTYARPGSYSAVVTSTDQGGGTASRTVTEVAQAAQSIAFAPIPGHTYGDAPFTISATGGGSGKAVAFASTTLTVCGLSAATSGSDSSGNGTGGATVTLLTAGTCTITADQGGVSNTAGTAIYTPAPQASQSFAAQQAPQAISFGALPNALLGDAPVAVGATGGATGNPVTFTASPGSVCTAGGTNGATITLVGVGTCTVTASQAGTANYQAAPGVSQSFTVAYPPLYGTLRISSSPAGPIVTGSTVAVALTLGNHTAMAQTVTLKVTLAFKGRHNSLSFTIPSLVRLDAGQTSSRNTSFRIAWWFPRGSYTLTETAIDGSGDTTSSSATVIVS